MPGLPPPISAGWPTRRRWKHRGAQARSMARNTARPTRPPPWPRCRRDNRCRRCRGIRAETSFWTMTDSTMATNASRRRRLALALMVIAQFIVILDFSIVNVALPVIQNAVGFSAVGVEGVITAYATAFGGVLILGGRMADLWGRRRGPVAPAGCRHQRSDRD